MIACVYRMSRTNVGDKACCPADYLPLGHVVKLDIAYLEQDASYRILQEADHIVLGGGGVFYFEESVARLIDQHGPKTVIWGAGANRHGSRSQTYPKNLYRCALVGLRDDCHEWVPCASCLSPLFDSYHEARSDESELVIYEHKSFPILDGCDEWPRLKNNAALDEALRFIASGRVVVTNSYHGAYWALLLGRRTIVYQPFSSKFYGMKWQPPIAYTPSELREIIRNGPRELKNRLHAARERTATFYEQVCEVFMKAR